MKTALSILLNLPLLTHASEQITLSQGYVYKFRCEGKLLVSAVGDERILRLEALPKEIGCGAVVKAEGAIGQTNILFETSSGSFNKLILVLPHSVTPKKTEIFIGGEK